MIFFYHLMSYTYFLLYLFYYNFDSGLLGLVNEYMLRLCMVVLVILQFMNGLLIVCRFAIILRRFILLSCLMFRIFSCPISDFITVEAFVYIMRIFGFTLKIQHANYSSFDFDSFMKNLKIGLTIMAFLSKGFSCIHQ